MALEFGFGTVWGLGFSLGVMALGLGHTLSVLGLAAVDFDMSDLELPAKTCMTMTIKRV